MGLSAAMACRRCPPVKFSVNISSTLSIRNATCGIEMNGSIKPFCTGSELQILYYIELMMSNKSSREEEVIHKKQESWDSLRVQSMKKAIRAKTYFWSDLVAGTKMFSTVCRAVAWTFEALKKT
jgi:hypothetical protein